MDLHIGSAIIEREHGFADERDDKQHQLARLAPHADHADCRERKSGGRELVLEKRLIERCIVLDLERILRQKNGVLRASDPRDKTL